jgi:small subunit ribosomal protein S1
MLTKTESKQLQASIPLQVSDTVEAVVIAKAGKKLVLDIEGYSLGIVPPKEMSAEADDLKIGDKTMAYVLKLENDEGQMILSLRRTDREKIWATLNSKFSSDEALLVKAVEANKGGLLVETGGVRGFLPVSQLSQENYPRVEGGDKNKILEILKSYIGKNFTVKILTMEPENNKLIFSEKKATEIQQAQVISKVKIGNKVKATVTGIADFGIFVRFNIAGSEETIDGLVHISEISWDKVTNLRKMFKNGQEIDAEIISTENNRVSLSIKKLTPDPWAKEFEKYEEGQIIKGKISKITPFGAFVKINQKIEGLLHVSEITDKKVDDPHELIKEGKEYDLRIISIEPQNHRLALSLKRTKEEKKKLKDSKIPKKILDKLKAAGYKKLEDVLLMNQEDLAKAKLTKKETELLIKKLQA